MRLSFPTPATVWYEADNMLCVIQKYQRLVVVLLFLPFSVLLIANPKKLLYTVANPARGLLNRVREQK